MYDVQPLICTFTEPFGDGQAGGVSSRIVWVRCVCLDRHRTQDWHTEPRGFDQTQVKNPWCKQSCLLHNHIVVRSTCQLVPVQNSSNNVRQKQVQDIVNWWPPVHAFNIFFIFFFHFYLYLMKGDGSIKMDNNRKFTTAFITYDKVTF